MKLFKTIQIRASLLFTGLLVCACNTLPTPFTTPLHSKKEDSELEIKNAIETCLKAHSETQSALSNDSGPLQGNLEKANSCNPPKTPNEAIVYRTFKDKIAYRYVIKGTHVAFLMPTDIPESQCSKIDIQKLVAALDKAYAYYSEVNGKEPSRSKFNYEGLLSINVVHKPYCGAACGQVGVTGIEISENEKPNDYFSQICRALKNNEFNQIPFYELGRNFNLNMSAILPPPPSTRNISKEEQLELAADAEIENQLRQKEKTLDPFDDTPALKNPPKKTVALKNGKSKTLNTEYKHEPDLGASMGTGYAVAMRFLSMEASGIQGAPFNEKPFNQFKQEVIDLADYYEKDPTATPENTLYLEKGPNNPNGGSGPDLVASFYLRLDQTLGRPASKRMIPKMMEEIRKLPQAQNDQDALDHFAIAASRAAKENLITLFDTQWKFHLSEKAKSTIRLEQGMRSRKISRPSSLPTL